MAIKDNDVRVVGYKTSEEIGGVLTMEQLIPKEELTPEQEERRKIIEYYEKKYNMRPQKFEEYIKGVK